MFYHDEVIVTHLVMESMCTKSSVPMSGWGMGLLLLCEAVTGLGPISNTFTMHIRGIFIWFCYIETSGYWPSLQQRKGIPTSQMYSWLRSTYMVML